VPRVNTVKKAAKDYPESGIKKGDQYFWWHFRHGPMVRSKEYPKPWQLTRSEFYGTLLQIQDRIANIHAEDADDLKSQVDEIASELRSLGEECREKHDNMPDGLQDGDTGQLLEERASAMESAADELEGIDIDAPDEEELVEEVREEMREGLEAENRLLSEDESDIEIDLADSGKLGGLSDEDKKRAIQDELALRKEKNEQVWKGLEEEIGQRVEDRLQEKLQELIEEIQNVNIESE